MRRCSISIALFTVALTAPLTAAAQENCPKGAWFCEQVDVEAAPEAAPAQPPEAAPPSREGRAGRTPRHGTAAPPPVVVYQPNGQGGPPPQIVIVTPAGQPPPRVVVRTVPPPPPAPAKRRWRPEWGINLRLEGVALGKGRGAAEDAAMGGLGLSLRYRPVPAFAFDLGVDVLGGVDYNGYERTEVPLSLNGILFVNPRSRVQFYFMGGLHVSHAEVKPTGDVLLDADGETDAAYYTPANTEYDYFGGQGGFGLEFRISRRVALNIDALAFIRNRTDEGTVPEFRDPETGRTTDTSGGGLFRGGLSFYW